MDIKDVKKQKENLEKRIFNLIKKFQEDHGVIITDISFWAPEDNPTFKNNVTLVTRFEENTDRNLIKVDRENNGGD